jgi:hypothetical protein
MSGRTLVTAMRPDTDQLEQTKAPGADEAEKREAEEGEARRFRRANALHRVVRYEVRNRLCAAAGGRSSAGPQIPQVIGKRISRRRQQRRSGFLVYL